MTVTVFSDTIKGTLCTVMSLLQSLYSLRSRVFPQTLSVCVHLRQRKVSEGAAEDRRHSHRKIPLRSSPQFRRKVEAPRRLLRRATALLPAAWPGVVRVAVCRRDGWQIQDDHSWSAWGSEPTPRSLACWGSLQQSQRAGSRDYIVRNTRHKLVWGCSLIVVMCVSRSVEQPLLGLRLVMGDRKAVILERQDVCCTLTTYTIQDVFHLWRGCSP